MTGTSSRESAVSHDDAPTLIIMIASLVSVDVSLSSSRLSTIHHLCHHFIQNTDRKVNLTTKYTVEKSVTTVVLKWMLFIDVSHANCFCNGRSLFAALSVWGLEAGKREILISTEDCCYLLTFVNN